jgi:L-ribulose-5-phosphate 3-epimerase
MTSSSDMISARMGGLTDEGAFDLRGQIALHVALGWKTIEFRNIAGCALADLDDTEINVIAVALAESGLHAPIASSRIGNWARPITGPFAPDLAELARIGAIAPALGTKAVRVMSWPNPDNALPETKWRACVLDRMARLCDHAERVGLTLLHENCAGWASQGAEQSLDLIETINCSQLRLLLDVGNLPWYGIEPLAFATAVEPYVAHVHLKDVNEAGDDFCLPGEGIAKLSQILTMLDARGYTGAFAIEPHLWFRPHEGRTTLPHDATDGYLAYAQAAAALVRTIVQRREGTDV